MRFLADENCDMAVVRALRNSGHEALTANGVGIVLLRFPTNARSQIGSDVVRAVSGFAAQLENAFVVIEPGQVRITKPQT